MTEELSLRDAIIAEMAGTRSEGGHHNGRLRKKSFTIYAIARRVLPDSPETATAELLKLISEGVILRPFEAREPDFIMLAPADEDAEKKLPNRH